MIPKIIHYVWLSNDPFPEKIQLCITSWKKYYNTPQNSDHGLS